MNWKKLEEKVKLFACTFALTVAAVSPFVAASTGSVVPLAVFLASLLVYYLATESWVQSVVIAYAISAGVSVPLMLASAVQHPALWFSVATAFTVSLALLPVFDMPVAELLAAWSPDNCDVVPLADAAGGGGGGGDGWMDEEDEDEQQNGDDVED